MFCSDIINRWWILKKKTGTSECTTCHKQQVCLYQLYISNFILYSHQQGYKKTKWLKSNYCECSNQSFVNVCICRVLKSLGQSEFIFVIHRIVCCTRNYLKFSISFIRIQVFLFFKRFYFLKKYTFSKYL